MGDSSRAGRYLCSLCDPERDKVEEMRQDESLQRVSHGDVVAVMTLLTRIDQSLEFGWFHCC